jgi:hypothetical protein
VLLKRPDVRPYDVSEMLQAFAGTQIVPTVGGRLEQCVKVHASQFSCHDLGDAAYACARIERPVGDRLLSLLEPAILAKSPCVEIDGHAPHRLHDASTAALAVALKHLAPRPALGAGAWSVAALQNVAEAYGRRSGSEEVAAYVAEAVSPAAWLLSPRALRAFADSLGSRCPSQILTRVQDGDAEGGTKDAQERH